MYFCSHISSDKRVPPPGAGPRGPGLVGPAGPLPGDGVALPVHEHPGVLVAERRHDVQHGEHAVLGGEDALRRKEGRQGNRGVTSSTLKSS